MKRSYLALTAIAAGISACAVGPDFKQPDPPTSADYGNASKQAETAADDGTTQRFVSGMDLPDKWWTLFKSDKLSGLVEKAMTANPNVTAAQAALRQSHELYSAQWTAFLPNVQGGFGAQRSKTASGTIAPVTVLNNPYYNLYTAQLSLSYVPDVFGGNRRALEVAKAQEENSRFQLEATYLTLSSNVVVTAMQEASLRGQIATTQRLLAIQHQVTETVHKQRTLGTASNLDVLTQEAAEAQTAQMLPPLEKQLAQSRDALTALLGRLPSDEPSETFSLADLTLPTELPVSLPSKLVEQRPDIRQAEENMHAASAEVGVAVANMLPQFAITGNYGTNALGAGQLFTPYNGFWSIGGSFTQTLFDAGELLHKRRAADAALDQAAAQYRAAVIQGCQNVADTLRALQSDADALKAAEKSEQAAKTTFDLAQRQYKLGTIALLIVLNAEQTYRQAELSLVQAQASRYSDTAGLFQALGGGWWNRAEKKTDE